MDVWEISGLLSLLEVDWVLGWTWMAWNCWGTPAPAETRRQYGRHTGVAAAGVCVCVCEGRGGSAAVRAGQLSFMTPRSRNSRKVSDGGPSSSGSFSALSTVG